MKKILSSLLASLVAVAFAGITFAAQPAKVSVKPVTSAQTSPSKHAMKKHHKMARHHIYHKKHHRNV